MTRNKSVSIHQRSQDYLLRRQSRENRDPRDIEYEN
jgi:hypothetical protein